MRIKLPLPNLSQLPTAGMAKPSEVLTRLRSQLGDGFERLAHRNSVSGVPATPIEQASPLDGLRPANPAATTFDLGNAQVTAHLSKLAYQDEATVRSQLAEWGFDMESFSYIDDAESDTQ